MGRTVKQIWTALGIPADYSQTRGLPVQHEATRLVSIGRNNEGRLIRLTPRTAVAWRKMQQAAAGHGLILMPISGFRSVARQTEIIRRKISAGTPLVEILRFVAAPGCSEHHTGKALDLGSSGSVPLDASFAHTAEYRWLMKNAATFGFHLSYPRKNLHGIGYEPWHWCWRSRRMAR